VKKNLKGIAIMKSSVTSLKSIKEPSEGIFSKIGKQIKKTFMGRQRPSLQNGMDAMALSSEI